MSIHRKVSSLLSVNVDPPLPRPRAAARILVLVLVFVFTYALLRSGYTPEEVMSLVSGGCLIAGAAVAQLLPRTHATRPASGIPGA